MTSRLHNSTSSQIHVSKETKVNTAKMGDRDLRRLQTNDIEVGYADALQKTITRHVVPAKPVSQRKLTFEHKRPRILRECMAEATGVFYYVYVLGVRLSCHFC